MFVINNAKRKSKEEKIHDYLFFFLRMLREEKSKADLFSLISEGKFIEKNDDF